MSHTSRIICGFILVAALAGVAQAGITSWNPYWDASTALDPTYSGWQWSSPTTWDVWESYVGSTPTGITVGCDGSADADPTIHISKTVTNGSTFDWTSYQIVISGSAGVGYVPGSATSDKFSGIGAVGNTITYSAPLTVLQGQAVTFGFDITIPAGLFSFDIQQTPTPEPVSLLMFGLGALFLRRR